MHEGVPKIVFLVWIISCQAVMRADKVMVTNMTGRTLYAAIICTQLKPVNRYQELYEAADSPNALDKVVVIQPAATVSLEVPLRAITQYDRNLWVTDSADAFATIFARKTRVGMSSIAAYTIGSSTVPRYVGIRGSTLKIFDNKAQAERYSARSALTATPMGVSSRTQSQGDPVPLPYSSLGKS